MSGEGLPAIAVLLVDDQALVAEAIRRALAAASEITLHYCANPEEAVPTAERVGATVILQDLVMPGVDGLDLVGRFRSHEATRDTPIIVLSTREEAATKQEAFARGANDYLIKIPDQLELIARVRYHARGYLNLGERNRADAALRASELRLQKIIMHNADGLLVVDPQGAIRFANPAAEQILRRKESELIGTAFAHRAVEGETAEVIFPAADDSTSAEIRAVTTEWDGQPALLVSLRDVTERKRAEEARKRMESQLQQAQKLESIGQLAAGIAHEINTPAQYLLDNGRFLQDASTDLLAVFSAVQELLPAIKASGVPPAQLAALEERMVQANYEFLAREVPGAIEQSLKGVEHIAKIVAAMKDFARPSSTDKTEIDLNKAIETTLTVSRHEWSAVADVVTDLAADLPPVPCLPGEINQVFLNLIVNAAQAIAEKTSGSDGRGRITVATALHAGAVEVRIQDTGVGIPEHIRDRVFDPFVTTRDVGKGTGQGLTIARSIVVDKHDGRIGFETQPGVGTTFLVTLPVSPG